MARQRRYWDSCCFLGWFAQEADKVDACAAVIHAAERGDVVLVTSALTIAEVVKVKGQDQLSRKLNEDVKEFFKRDYVVVRQLDRFIAERARDLWWEHGVEPKDAVHVATAMAMDVAQLDTFDKGLLNQTGLIGSPPLVIGRPFMVTQLELTVDAPIGERSDSTTSEVLEQIDFDLATDTE